MDENSSNFFLYHELREKAINEYLLRDPSQKLLVMVLELTEKFPDRCDGVVYFMLARSLDPLKNVAQCLETYELAFSKDCTDNISLTCLGSIYQAGNLGAPDYVAAIDCYQKAENDSVALFRLAGMHRLGLGTPENVDLAHSIYKSIANTETSPKCGHALLNLGNFYWLGQGVPVDSALALSLYKRSAKKGLADAQHRLGEIYRLGRVVPKDLEKALKYFRQAADQGSKDAHFKIGEMFLRAQDPLSAKKAFETAAELGHVKANGKLGQMYYMGDGVPTDYEKGFKYLLIAAEAEDITARYNIGLMYYHGRGVEQSREKALGYYLLAADAGHRGAQNNIGNMYHRAGDYTAAAQYYQLAADQGNTNSQFKLAEMCHVGQGVPTDPETALKYYTLAADGGYVHGQVSLADWHHRIGGYHHYTLALKYYRMALNQGHLASQRKIAQVEKRLEDGILTYSRIFANYNRKEESTFGSERRRKVSSGAEIEEKFVPF